MLPAAVRSRAQGEYGGRDVVYIMHRRARNALVKKGAQSDCCRRRRRCNAPSAPLTRARGQPGLRAARLSSVWDHCPEIPTCRKREATNVKRIVCSTSSGGDGSGGDSSRGGGSERRCVAWHSSPAELFVLGRTLEEPVYCADVRRSQRCHDRIHPILYAHGEQQKGRAAEGQGSRRAGQQKGS